MAKSSGLPEDSNFRNFAPLKNVHVLSEHGEPLWDSSLSLKRKARMILLMNFISTHFRLLPLTPESGHQQKSYNFEDFSANEDLDHQDNISNSFNESEDEETYNLKNVEELVDDIEVSDDILELKARMLSLKKKITIDPSETVIIFDTNCYMQDFAIVKKIFDSRVWKIIVPLAVVTELEGLSQDGNVGNRAADCLLYLRQNVSKTFQLQTLRGTIMPTMTFLSEDWNSSFSTADDVILEVCKFHANVCLITNDINLRLKARTVNVPVLDSSRKLLMYCT
jgi:rRNA-processing protein FCF1